MSQGKKAIKTMRSLNGIKIAAVDCLTQSVRHNAEYVGVEVLNNQHDITMIVEDDSDGIDEGVIGKFLDPLRVKFYFPTEINVTSTVSEWTHRARWMKGVDGINLSGMEAADWEQGCRFEIQGLLPPEDLDSVDENWLTGEIKSNVDFELEECVDFELDVDVRNL